jgi:transposase InsO family protein
MSDAPAAREWFSAAELADMRLPGLPTEKKNVLLMAERFGWLVEDLKGTGWRKREGRGGGVEFHYSMLPACAQMPIAIAINAQKTEATHAAARISSRRQDIWAWWERQPDTRKAKGRQRAEALDAVQWLVAGGTEKVAAMALTAQTLKVSLSTLYSWEALVAGADRCDWMPLLTPRHVGRTVKTECAPEAWNMLKTDYLRPEQPSFTACYRRLQAVAAEKQWTIPSEDTLKRRIDKLPVALRTRERQGEDALKVLYPYQQRDRSVFHALEAVNADGHKWDVFVKWPNGEIGRPLMVAFQDLYSGKILSWRVDRSENRESVRLAFGDMLERFGIPSACYLDNGRSFASKWLTGGIANRFRFKVKDEDPAGIMTQLGVKVHWTTPYSGQSKPIERAFGELTEIAKHPAFAGAYVGNSPMAKPSNYGDAAVPLDVFIKTIGAEIAAHNARAGRRSTVAAGRSFDEVFATSYAAAPIRKVTEEQRRLWLMAAEAVRVGKRDGAIELLGNRYWDEKLLELSGQKVVVRFDPEAMHEPLHVYTLAGLFVVSAQCQHAAGFNSTEAAREHGRRRREWMRGVKMQAAAEKAMSIAAVAELLPEPAETVDPATKVVRPIFGDPVRYSGAMAAAATKLQTDQDEFEDQFNRAIADQRAQRGQHIRLVEEADSD